METLKRPIYQKPHQDDFYRKLRAEVQQILDNPKYYRQNVIKSFALLALYIGSYAGILWFGNNTYLLFTFYIMSGMAMITLFINAFHDAVHGAVFRTRRYNRWFTGILWIFGSNTWLWSKRHIALHHAFPSVQDWDVDIKQSDIVRIFPNSRWFPFHKYQHLYMWLLYPTYSLNWILIRDFKDFYGSRDNYVKRIAKIPPIEHVKLIAAKIFNLGYTLFLPMALLHQPWQTVLYAWLSMHVCGSMLGVIALISTHVDEEAEFPMTDPDGHLDATWAVHQMKVTKDFSADSAIANFLYGGFTHHVAHHLFPDVAHTYYPRITPLIRKYAAEYNLPYKCYPFTDAVRSHFRLLKEKGNSPGLMQMGEL